MKIDACYRGLCMPISCVVFNNDFYSFICDCEPDFLGYILIKNALNP